MISRWRKSSGRIFHARIATRSMTSRRCVLILRMSTRLNLRPLWVFQIIIAKRIDFFFSLFFLGRNDLRFGFKGWESCRCLHLLERFVLFKMKRIIVFSPQMIPFLNDWWKKKTFAVLNPLLCPVHWDFCCFDVQNQDFLRSYSWCQMFVWFLACNSESKMVFGAFLSLVDHVWSLSSVSWWCISFGILPHLS